MAAQPRHLHRLLAFLDRRRGDSGFCREELMAWCEANQVDYVLGLAKNERLRAEIAAERAQAAAQYQQTGQAARIFKDFTYQTRESWSRARRVVAKAEHLEKGANPRFVVTSLPSAAWAAQALYEELYCARGEMENRIKGAPAKPARSKWCKSTTLKE
jgi:hypothetical protein